MSNRWQAKPPSAWPTRQRRLGYRWSQSPAACSSVSNGCSRPEFPPRTRCRTSSPIPPAASPTRPACCVGWAPTLQGTGRLQPRSAISTGEYDLECLRLGGPAEGVVGVHHLVELELVSSEPLCRQLAGGNELEQHRGRIRADQPRRDRDVVDPKIM